MTKDIKSACPQCSNTVNHTPGAGNKSTGELYQCNSCGTFSTLEQLRSAESRINGRALTPN